MYYSLKGKHFGRYNIYLLWGCLRSQNVSLGQFTEVRKAINKQWHSKNL